VFDPVQVVLAKLAFNVALVLVKADIFQDRVPLNYLIEDVDVQRESLNCVEVFDELPAHRAPNSEVVME